MKLPEPYNPQVELAKKRNYAAAERTLMAWIRTSLSLITFGFSLDRVINAIYSTSAATNQTLRLSTWFGLSFIALGVFALVGAIYQHRKELRKIHQLNYVYTEQRSLSTVVATILVAIGVLAFITILF